MNVTIEIVMYGLIALVPPAELPGEMTALLVDSNVAIERDAEDRPAQYGECLVKHLPQIEFSTRRQDCRKAGQGCTVVRGTNRCTCDVQDWDVTIEARRRSENKNKKPLSTRAPEKIPGGEEADIIGNFAWVPNVTSFSTRTGKEPREREGELRLSLNRNFLTDNPPPALAARFQFPVDNLSSCRLANRPLDGLDTIFAYAFRPIGEPASNNSIVQAVAQEVVASHEIEIRNDEEPVLVMSPIRDSGRNQTRRFHLKGSPINITLSNQRESHYTSSGHPCDDGIGRDFALFYELAEEVPPWKLRPIPHIEHAPYTSYPESIPRACERKKHTASRPVCAMAVFAPQEESKQE